MKEIHEPVKKHRWMIRVRRPGQTEDDVCKYQATHGPVTAEHVRTSPYVKDWIAGDRLVSICPTNAKAMASADTQTPTTPTNGQ